MTSIETRVDFSEIRYGQVWEDADVLLEGLDVQAGHVCVSVASAGDNTLALLTRQPARVIALDLSRAQIACLELRVAAYRELSHPQLLELIGSRPSWRREALYRRCRPALSADTARFWDARAQTIAAGIGNAGRLERYFALFRQHILPLVHTPARVRDLLTTRDREAREAFYEQTWNTRSWRLLFKAFFSRFTMGRIGRDPALFRYSDGPVANPVLARTRRALIELDPTRNPYLHWMLTGTHGEELPLALRPESFDSIRANLDRLEWRCESLESFVTRQDEGADRYNLSNVFEYVSFAEHRRIVRALSTSVRRGARLAYWNLFVDRHCARSHDTAFRPLSELSHRLHRADRGFFYSDFIVEEAA